MNTEELYGLYRTADIIGVIQARKLRCAGHRACIGQGRSAERIL
jgi:hypothetical protein